MLTYYFYLNGIDLEAFSIKIIAHRIQQVVRQNCPVRTGRMCAAIHAYPYKKYGVVVVRCDVIYAEYQNTKTRNAGWWDRACREAESVIDYYRVQTSKKILRRYKINV